MPHVVATGTGTWLPEDGYSWVDPNNVRDLRVRWTPNLRLSKYPHVFTTRKEGEWLPDDGYEWIDGGRSLYVRWCSNCPSRKHPHVLTSEEEGVWQLADGYLWVDPNGVNDFRVRWCEECRFTKYPHISTSRTEGWWRTDDGYTWVNPDDKDDLSVRWEPGKISRDANMRAAINEGYWQPQVGYEWIDVDRRCWGCVKKQTIGSPHPDFDNVVLTDFVSTALGDHAFYEPADGWVWVTPGQVGPTKPAAKGTPSRIHEHVLSAGDGVNWEPAPGYAWLVPPRRWTKSTEFKAVPVEDVDRLSMVQNITEIRKATASGDKPPFESLWDFYKFNYDGEIAKKIVPDSDRCAFLLSMALDLKPQSGEASLEQLANLDDLALIMRALKDSKAWLFGEESPHILPEVTDAELARRYYIRAAEVANRLSRDWGEPEKKDGSEAREFLKSKTAIIYLEDAYFKKSDYLYLRFLKWSDILRLRLYGTGDHIDVWNADRHGATASTLPLESARKVWVWQIPN